ncbi:hypothetical protein ACOMHN_056859 [Nucella lapillus]
MAKSRRRLLILVTLCLLAKTASYGQERGKYPYVNSTFIPYANVTSSVWNNSNQSTEIRAVVSEKETYEVSIQGNRRSKEKTHTGYATTIAIKPENQLPSYITNDTGPESKLSTNLTLSDTPFLLNDFPDWVNHSSLLGGVLYSQTARRYSLLWGNGTKPSVWPKPRTVTPRQPERENGFNAWPKAKPTPPAQSGRMMYHLSVGGNCTKTFFRSDTDSPVTHCPESAVVESYPWKNKLRRFKSLSLTAADMGLCRSGRDTGHLRTNYVLYGRITFSSEDEPFLTNKSRVRGDFCIRLHSPPSTIIQLTVNQDAERVRSFKFLKAELKPGQREEVSTLADSRVLQSEDNEAVLVVHDLFKEVDHSPVGVRLLLAFQAVAWCRKEQLEVRCPRHNTTGYIQTPHWNGHTRYNSNMQSCVTVALPPANQSVIMVSFVSLDVGRCLHCASCDTLEIYLSPGCTGSPVSTIRTPEMAFPAAYQTRVMSVLFQSDHCYQATGFRLLYSFHSAEHTPRQLAGGKWDCSNADSGPVLVQHFVCSSDTFCQNAEDKAAGCPPEGLCGDISLRLEDGGKCYRYVRTERVLTRNQASRLCGKYNGFLANLKTEAEWKQVADFWVSVSDAPHMQVGLDKLSHTKHMYASLWMWSDKTVAYYMNVSHSPARLSPPYCAMFLPRDRHVTMMTCHTRTRANLLCEVRRSQGKEGGDYEQKPKVVLPVPTRPAWDLPHMIKCPKEHAAFAFLRCYRFSYCYVDKDEDIQRCFQEHPLLEKTMFSCKDGKRHVQYSLVCDFHNHCQDKSDDNFCVLDKCTSRHFSYKATKRCILRKLLCDGKKQCSDGSDEESCWTSTESHTVASPAVIDFTGTGGVTVTPVNTTHADQRCPETHFQCPHHGYCLPVYVRCNDVRDCPGKEDEADCGSYTCPGYYRCSGSKMCIHADHMCDGVHQCPRHDDEMMCNITCPDDCVCAGFAFTCKDKFPANQYPQLRYLNADNTGMSLHDVAHNALLIHISLRHCNMKEVGVVHLPNVQTLDLSYNALTSFTGVELKALKNLRSLSLSFNELLSLNSLDYANKTFRHIIFLDMSGSDTREITETTLLPFPALRHLNLSRSKLQKIQKPGFSVLPKLTIVDLSECPLTEFYEHLFKGLPHLETIYTSKYQMCCPTIVPEQFCISNCHSPSDGVSSCAALLRTDGFRAFLVIYTFLALVGNAYSFVYRVFGKGVTAKLGFDIFVTHLCVSDFLMGVYLAIIGIADRWYYGTYQWNDLQWKQSVVCQLAGFLSLLSSEVSAFLICFITLERFLLIQFPHKNLRFTPMSAQTACVLGWVVGLALAAIPLLPFSPPWDFYGQTGICIPLPIMTNAFPGSNYSFYLMIVFNFILFLLIAVGQFLIFWSLRSQLRAISSSRKKAKDIAIARRLLAVVMTDFLCWFPIGLLGLMARNGVPISGDVNVAMAIFVLPLNSALNPFLYTLQVLLERRRIARSGTKSSMEMTTGQCPACAKREQYSSRHPPSVSAAGEQLTQSTGQKEGQSMEKMMNNILEDNVMTPGPHLIHLTQIIEGRESKLSTASHT